MYQEAHGGGMSRSGRALREDTEHRGTMSLSEVERYLEQMSPDESESLWTELDELATHELAA